MRSTLAFTRRCFLLKSAALAASAALPASVGAYPAAEDRSVPAPAAEGPHMIGPLAEYSPQVGTLVSMLNWMHESLLRATQRLTTADLDYLHDAQANSIGALMLHLVATEVVYQDMTFFNQKGFSAANEKTWGVAMKLGAEARQQIKGNNLEYYRARLQQVRATTLAELKKRDDQWLMLVDPSFFNNQPTNNYCKWFHVAEHIGNHRGQITWLAKRLPGAAADGAD